MAKFLLFCFSLLIRAEISKAKAEGSSAALPRSSSNRMYMKDSIEGKKEEQGTRMTNNGGHIDIEHRRRRGLGYAATRPLPTKGRELDLDLDDELLTNCYKNLRDADASNDSYLSKNEYLQFVYVESRGYITSETAPTFSELPWELTMLYHHSLLVMTGSSGVDLRTDDLESLQTTVVYICDEVNNYVSTYLETKSPTNRPSSSPTDAPSAAPSSPPSNTPTTKSPTPAPLSVSVTKPPVSQEEETVSGKNVSPLDNEEASDDDMLNYIIVSVAIGLGVLLLLGCIFFVRRRRQIREEKEQEIKVFSFDEEEKDEKNDTFIRDDTSNDVESPEGSQLDETTMSPELSQSSANKKNEVTWAANPAAGHSLK